MSVFVLLLLFSLCPAPAPAVVPSHIHNKLFFISLPQLSPPEIDLQLHPTKHPNGRIQIALAQETVYPFISLVPLLIDLPIVRPSITRQPRRGLDLRCVKRGRRERHAHGDGLAGLEGAYEIASSPGIVGEASSIVAMHGQAGAVPARETPRRVRLGGEADGYAGVGVGDTEDADCIGYRVSAAREVRVVGGGEVRGEVCQGDRVGLGR